jgi:16S rRNA (guanine527-N7)-methyltransferase
VGRDELVAVLDEAQRRGLLGGSIDGHLDHGFALAGLIEQHAGVPATFLDLGSGAGVPGLVLAVRWPDAHAVLLDAAARRVRWLRAAVAALGLAVEVLEGRAETLAHDPTWRERLDLVTARAFGAPPVAAENGAGFLRIGGNLVVTDPPGAPPVRWPAAPLATLGLDVARTETEPYALTMLRKLAATPSQYPRGPGRPAKRPLW